MHLIQISITDIEEFLILTDDIVNILRYRKAFYTDEGRLRYFENAREYQDAVSHENNFIVEKLIHSKKYLNEGLLNCPAEDIFMENLLPLQKLILALYRNGTAQECYYYADDTFSDKYLLKAITLRIVDMMLYEVRKNSIKKYFLTWTTQQSRNMDEWVAIAYTYEDIKRLYEKEIEENEPYDGLDLQAYEYVESYGFMPINII